jgi:hypothetical protein
VEFRHKVHVLMCNVIGQEIDNLNWFLCTTVALLMFSATCYIVARRVYQIL